MNKEYYEDDRPVDYQKYMNMSIEELDLEIEKLKHEHLEKAKNEMATA